MKIKYFVVAVAACAVQGVNAASTADYVQDGLIANWDAIDNAGTGTHNPNAATWKNLVQGGMDLTVDKGVWVDGNALSNDLGRAAYGNAILDYLSGEFVFKNEKPAKDTFFLFANGQSKYCLLCSDYAQFTNEWKMVRQVSSMKLAK